MTRPVQVRIGRDELLRVLGLKSLPPPMFASLEPNNLEPEGYLQSDVNAYLRQCNPGYKGVLPTVADLVACGGSNICTIRQAAEYLGLAAQTISKKIMNGEICAFKVAHFTRVLVEELCEYKENRDKGIAYGSVRRILCMTSSDLHEQLKLGKLQILEPGTSSTPVISRASVLRFLQKYLPDGISPESWLKERECSTEKLYTFRKIFKVFTIYKVTLERLISLGVVRAIRSFKDSSWWVSPESVRNYILWSSINMTAQYVADLYGLSDEEVLGWAGHPEVACPIHTNDSPWLQASCWWAILQQGSAPGFDALAWLDERLGEGNLQTHVISLPTTAKRRGQSPEQIIAAAEAGEILAFRTPFGEWRFPVRARQS